ncbi:MAG TPA: hypothetical protein VHR17_02060 [Thermoanaerobaculia bacterium]|nr:hypothetical protein [Thermoanaerobaculia bacterium]
MAFVIGLAVATPSVPAPETIPPGAVEHAVEEILAGGDRSLDLVLLLDPRLGANERRRRAAVRELEQILPLLSGESAVARARRDACDRELGARGAGSDLDSTIRANVHLHCLLAPFFSRHSFDCNQRATLHLTAARRLGIALPGYARSLDHAGLIFEDHGLVLDPYDGKLRSLLAFARGRGLSPSRGDGYFLRTPRRHYLVVAGPGGSVLRPLAPVERPDLVAPLEPLASLLLDAGAIALDPTTARAYAELALALDPTSADAHDTLGNLVADFDPARAAAEYAKALELDPHAARVHYNLAVLLQTRGEAGSAESEYRAALTLQPSLLAAIENLGALLATEPNQLDEARAFDARYPAWRARSAAARNVRMAGSPAAAKSRSNRGSSRRGASIGKGSNAM